MVSRLPSSNIGGEPPKLSLWTQFANWFNRKISRGASEKKAPAAEAQKTQDIRSKTQLAVPTQRSFRASKQLPPEKQEVQVLSSKVITRPKDLAGYKEMVEKERAAEKATTTSKTAKSAPKEQVKTRPAAKSEAYDPDEQISDLFTPVKDGKKTSYKLGPLFESRDAAALRIYGKSLLIQESFDFLQAVQDYRENPTKENFDYIMKNFIGKDATQEVNIKSNVRVALESYQEKVSAEPETEVESEVEVESDEEIESEEEVESDEEIEESISQREESVSGLDESRSESQVDLDPKIFDAAEKEITNLLASDLRQSTKAKAIKTSKDIIETQRLADTKSGRATLRQSGKVNTKDVDFLRDVQMYRTAQNEEDRINAFKYLRKNYPSLVPVGSNKKSIDQAYDKALERVNKSYHSD